MRVIVSAKAPELSRVKRKMKIDGPLSRFAVAVVEPEFGINLGYVARTAANFGIKKLIVVSAKRLTEKNRKQAELYAAHGRHLVDEIEYLSSFIELKKKFRVLLGTTAIEASRKSNITRRTLSPEECARKVSERFVRGKESVCFVFGRDTTGLTNIELKDCDYNVTIRTRSAYNTLNISHAAAILFYVFANNQSHKETAPVATSRSKGSLPAQPTRNERERAVSLFLKLAEDSDFHSFKQGLLRETLERVFNRGDPSLREIYLLMGLASKAGGKIRRLSNQAS